MSKSDDPRLDQLLISVDQVRGDQTMNRIKIALMGFNCDLGVARNGGRVGAKSGPAVFRKYLPKIGSVVNPEFGDLDLGKLQIVDYGDAAESDEDSLETVHEKLKAKVQQALADGCLPFVVGGGNDQSYPNARALMNHLGTGDLAVVNVDAHLDVRPLLGDRGDLAHSGSPFRQLLEDEHFSKKFVEFACQGAVCGAEHARYVRDRGGRLVWLSQLRADPAPLGVQFARCLDSLGAVPLFVSFDLDSVRGADCPGVSAPSVAGLDGAEALDLCRAAGRDRRVRLMDLSEFNPRVEEDRTARLAVHMFYHFLLGVAERC